VARGIRQAAEELRNDRLLQAQEEPEGEVIADTKEALLKRQGQALALGGFAPTPSSWPGGLLPEEPVGAPQHNLPAPRSSFVGRERELKEVKRWR
jgi:hypothetical protein